MKTPLAQRVQTAYKARVVIEPRLAKQIRCFVNETPTECQWYTQVRREEEADGTLLFTCYGDILIPPQKVGAEDVDMDPISVAKMWQERTKALVEKTGLDADSPTITDDINTEMGSAWNWCHSHVMMPIEPSKTDAEQWQAWVEMHEASGKVEHPPMMLIVNKKDEAFVRIYDPTTKIQFENISISIDVLPDPDLEYVRAAIANKLTPIEVKKKDPIKANPNYSEHKPGVSGKDWKTATQGPWGNHNPSFTGTSGKTPPSSGGSQSLRDQITHGLNIPRFRLGEAVPHQAVAEVGRSVTPQTGVGSRDSYFVLTNSDLKELTEGFDYAADGRERTRELGFTKIYRWITKNGTQGTMSAIQGLLGLYNRNSKDITAYLDKIRVIGSRDTILIEQEGTMLKNLLEFHQETANGLDLLDAVVAFDAIGEPEAVASLIDAFDLYVASPEETLALSEPQPMNPKFRILDEP